MAAKTQTTSLTIEPRDARTRARRAACAARAACPACSTASATSRSPFSVDARELRHALHAAGAVLELSGDGERDRRRAQGRPAPPGARRDVLHIDLLRVDLNKPIQAPVAVHLVGGEDAPGVKEGGVLEHVTREVTVEALPADIPESIDFDVSAMEINDTVRSTQLTAPAGSRSSTTPRPPSPPCRRRASRSSPRTSSRPRPSSSARAASAEGEEAEASRRGRGRGADERRGLRRRVAARLFGGVAPADWLIVGLGNPGGALRGHAAQRRLRGRPRAAQRWDLPRAEEEVRRPVRRGPHRRRRPARRGAAAADLHERGRALRRARARRARRSTSTTCSSPRRDRPAVRRHPPRLGGGPGRPQRAEVAASRGLGSPDFAPRADRRRPARTRPTRRSSPPRAREVEPAARRGPRPGRARHDAAERIVLGELEL